MALYLLKRVLLFIPTLLGITLITFILMRSLPGDPVAGMAGERANPETLARIRAELGQDKPLPLQYIGYLKLLATGELGRSYYTNRRISDDLLQKFPNTVRLALPAWPSLALWAKMRAGGYRWHVLQIRFLNLPE